MQKLTITCSSVEQVIACTFDTFVFSMLYIINKVLTTCISYAFMDVKLSSHLLAVQKREREGCILPRDCVYLSKIENSS